MITVCIHKCHTIFPTNLAALFHSDRFAQSRELYPRVCIRWMAVNIKLPSKQAIEFLFLSETSHPIQWVKLKVKQSLYRPGETLRVPGGRGSQISRQSAHEGGRVRSEPGGTWWRTGGEVKGKLANGVGSQYSHATSERGISSITQADEHTSAASSRLNWRPHLFKWTRQFLGKTKSDFCSCAITFRTSYTCGELWSMLLSDDVFCTLSI